MELPIRIIIVLFVAVVVGGSIIMFSQEMLNNARQSVNQLEVKDEEQILEAGSLSADDVLALANQCVRDNAGIEETICYAVFADDITFPTESGLVQGHVLVVESQENSVRFIYSPPNEVIIR